MLTFKTSGCWPPKSPGLHPNSQRFKKAQRPGLNRVKENLRTCDKGREMVLTRFAFTIAIDDKTLFRRIENYYAQETSSLTWEVRENKRGKTTREGGRRGGGNPGFFLGADAPLRNGATDRRGKQTQIRRRLLLRKGEGVHPLHPSLRSAPGKKYSSSFISFFMVLLTAWNRNQSKI